MLQIQKTMSGLLRSGATSLVILLSALSVDIKAQTSLSAGDVAITTVSADGSDAFSFVTFVSLAASTEIRFTDEGWDDALGSFGTASEGFIVWTASGSVAAGTEIIITNSTGTPSASSGSASKTGTFNVSGGGDQILVYQGTEASPTFIYAFNHRAGGFVTGGLSGSSLNTALPTGLTEGTNAFTATTHADNWQFNCTASTSSLAQYMIEANYTTNNATEFTTGAGSSSGCSGGGDTDPPVVQSITESSGANSASVDFTVTFDENANNITTDDFELTKTSTADGTIASVSASSGTSVTVTVNSITGTGTLRLDLKGSTDIDDDSDNTPPAAFTSGTAHAVDRDAPSISSVSLAADNSSIDVTFSEGVFDTNGGSGALETGDFSLSITGGTATSPTVTSVTTTGGAGLSGGETTIRVNFSVTGSVSGAETLEVDLGSNAVFDAAGNAAAANQTSNNTASMNDGTAPNISSVSLAADNSSIDVTFSEGVFDTNGGSGALETGDFSLSITGGTATSPSVTSVTTTGGAGLSGGETTIRVNFSVTGSVSGAETLEVDLGSNAVFDAAGNAAAANQTSNNTATLNDQTSPSISSVSLAADNSSIDVTFSEGVFDTNGGSGALETGDFSLSITGGTATSPTVTSVTTTGGAGLSGGETTIRVNFSVTGSVSGAETLEVDLGSNAVFDAAGNAANANQTSNNTASMNDATAPNISSVSLAANNGHIDVTFSEGVFDTNGGSGALETGDFSLSITGGTATSPTVTSVTTTGGAGLSGGETTVRVNFSVMGSVSGAETLEVDLGPNAVFDAAGNAADANQTSNNTASMADVTGPTVSSVSLAADNSSIDVTFNEGVFNTNGGSSALETSDFSLSITGGTATSPSVTSVTTTGGTGLSGGETTVRVNFSVTGTPNGSETLEMDLGSNAVFDAAGNAADANQTSNNTATMNDQVAPSDPVVTTPASTVTVNAASQTISGTHTENGVVVHAYADSDNNGVADNTTSLGSATVSSNAWSFSVSLTADQANNFVVVAIDGANNESNDVDVPTITEDSTNPADPVVTTPSSATTVNSATQTISGTHTEDGVTIHAYADSNNDGVADNTTSLGSATVASNAWSFSVSLTADQANNFVVQATDAAGNVSSDVDVPTITEDSTNPADPVVTTPASAITVNAASQTISGTHTEDGVVVHAYADDNNDGVADNSTSLGSATVSSNAWSFSVSLTADQANNFVVQAVDAVGNVSGDVDVPTITEDSTNPADPVVTTPASTTTVNAASQTISGTHTEDGVVVHAYADSDNNGVADNTTSLGSATVSSNAWSFSVNLTGDSDNNFVVQAADAAGNVSGDVDVPTITEDSTNPTVSSSSPADNDTDVGIADNITITFNEDIAFGTGNIQIIDLTDASNSVTIDAASPGSEASISGAVLTLNPTVSLDLNSNYAVQIAATAIDDLIGNSFAGITDNTTLNFTTINTAVAFDATSSNGAESTTSANLAVSLNAASGVTVTVDYAVTGTATGSGTDYTLADGTLTFNPGITAQNITIASIVDDALDEAGETVIVTLSNPTNAGLGTNTVHTYTINDNDDAPTIAFDATSSNAAESTTSTNLAVSLSAVSGRDVTVDYAVTGTATGSGTDYTLADGTLTITAGNSTENITIASIVGDALDEADETVIVTLSSPTNASLGTNQVHTYTILDDDATPTIAFDATSSSGAETTTSANLAVSLSAVSGRDVTVNYAVTGTATGSGTDYTLADGALTITAGNSTENITIASIVGDALDEADETVIVTLSSPTNASLGTNQVHTYTILDDDATPTIAFDATSSSGAESTTSANLAVSLSAVSGRDVTVDYAVTGTATGSGTDYTLADGTLTITAGSSTENITIASIVGDVLDEFDETVIVTLSSPTNASLGTNQVHTYTILDDDATPTVEFGIATDGQAESEPSQDLPIGLSAASGKTITVDYAATGTATGSGTDYTFADGTFTFDPGDQNLTLQLTGIIDDLLDEDDETIILTLSNPVNATLGSQTTLTYTITDNDDAPTVTLSVGSNSIAENGGTSSITATLSAVSGKDVTVNLGYSGTATNGTDYNGSASTSITISAGQSSANAAVGITATDDSDGESTETVIIDITGVTNGTENGVQQQTITIIDDDNASPVFTSSPVTAIDDNVSYSYTVNATDQDGELVSIAATTIPSWLSLNTVSGGEVTTLAGSGTSGLVDATGTSAQFQNPAGVAVDASGNVYVADLENHVIRKVTSAGVVTTFAGSGVSGFADGTGTAAQFDGPFGIDIDDSGNLYVADSRNHRIRKITPAGVVTTLAGSSAGFTDATGTSAQFNNPVDVAVDGDGNVFVADNVNNRIRKITSAGVVTTFAGSGATGSTNGTGTAAEFNSPAGLAIDGAGNIYVGGNSDHSIRKITSSGVVTTLAGSGTAGSDDGTGTAASFQNPMGLAFDNSGNLYVAEQSNNRIRKVTVEGVVTTLAGSSYGFANGIGTAAQFRAPFDVAIDGEGDLYVADHFNHAIRKVTTDDLVLSGNPAGQGGNHNVVLTASDGVGGVTNQNFTIVVTDVTAPDAPSLTSFSSDTGVDGSDGITSDNTLTFSGTAEANSTVELFIDGTSIGTTSADGSGDFSFDHTGTVLGDGAISVTAKATDAAGNTSDASTALNITIDATAPSAPSVSSISSDSGSDGSDEITNDNTLSLNGTAEANSTVEVFIDGNSIGTTTADGSGNFSFDHSTTTLSDATYSVTAKASDAAGNTSSASSGLSVTVDTSAPAVPVVSSITTDSGTDGADGLTNDNTLSFNGTSEADAIVEVFIDGTSIGTTTADGSGNFSFDHSGTTLADGPYNVTATATDKAGNTSAEGSALPVTVDTASPDAPVVDLADASDTGISSTDNLTNDDTPTIEGTAEVNAIIEVFDGGVSVGTTNADEFGLWSLTPSSALTEGTRSITAKATDGAGNVSAESATLSINLDVSLASPSLSPADNAIDILPNANLILTFAEDMNKETGNIAIKKTSDNSILETIDVTSSNVSISGGTVTIDPTNLLLPPTTEFYVSIDGGTFTDDAGNVYGGISNNTTWTFTIIEASVVSSVTVPTDGTYKIGDNLDFTLDWTLPVTITGAPTIPVTIGSTTVNASLVGTVSNSGTATFRYTVTESDLDADGIALGSSISLNGGTIKDAFDVDAVTTLNNVASTVLVLIDGVKPIPTLSSSAASVVNDPFTVTFTYDEEVSSFELSDITVSNGTAGNFTQVVAGKSWSAEITPTVAGDVTISLAAGVATDLAGNTSAAGSNSITRQYNNNPTDISMSSQDIDERNAVDDVVGTFSTTDADATDSHTYTLVSGTGDTDNGSFTIDGNSLKAAVVFDFENRDSYSIRVKTDDGATGGTFEKVFAITINNVGEAVIVVEGDGAFEMTILGFSDTKTWTVTNNGDAATEVRVVNTTTAFSITPGSLIVGAGQSIDVTAVFIPEIAQVYNGQIVFNYTIADTEQANVVLPVSGEGVIVTSTDDELARANIKFFPNPADKTLYVELPNRANSPIDVRLTDINGKALFERGGVTTNQVSIDVSDYKNGVYIVVLSDGKSVLRKKVMIKR